MDEIIIAMIIVGMAVVTYIPRLIPILKPIKSEKWLKYLKFVPVSLFSALIFPDLFLDKNQEFVFDEELIAGLITIFTAWKSRNILVTMLVGVIVLYLLKFQVSGG